MREWVGVEGGKGEDKRREAGRAIVDQSTSSHRNHVAMNDTERSAKLTTKGGREGAAV